jgi:DNA-binding HxlR family transcriptional regulator
MSTLKSIKSPNITLQSKKSSCSFKGAGLPAVETASKVGIECRMIVIIQLLPGPMRFNELLKTGMHSKTLARALKYLLAEEIVQREVLGTRPFAVQYLLTEKGKQLDSVVSALNIWGERWLRNPVHVH